MRFLPLVVSLATAVGALLVSPESKAQSLYSFQEALSHGVVDLSSAAPDDEYNEILAHLRELQPGIVNRLGYFWGGPSQQRIDHVARIASRIRQELPQTLIGGGLPEGIAPAYHQTLKCGGTLGTREFSASDLTSGAKQQFDSAWLDLAKPATADFYTCTGQMFIDAGFQLLHFEAPTMVLDRASSRPAAVKAYQQVAKNLTQYAAQRGKTIYFSGDSALAHIISISAVYYPSRFYHVTIPKFAKFQNKVTNPGVGVGYYYSLSPAIVADARRDLPPNVAIFFYIDNWDPKQDDLRRFMELDAQNRRQLIVQSARTARAGGAYFVPSLDHCIGCVKPDAVVDKSEIRPDGRTEYDAVRSGDLSAIREALQDGSTGTGGAVTAKQVTPSHSRK
jgi:hypothetical protein